MADQGKWFKLWCSSLHDQELQNLELDDWARWAMLGTYIKEHGKEGKIRFEYPYRALLTLFRLGSITDAVRTIKRFPNYTLGERNVTVSPETNATVSLEIEITNWHKYQGDLSSTRVRNFRAKKRHRETIQEETRQDKTRRDKNIHPTLAEVVAFSKEENLSLDCEKFFNHYQSTGWKVGRNPMKDWKASAKNAAKDWAPLNAPRKDSTPAWMK